MRIHSDTLQLWDLTDAVRSIPTGVTFRAPVTTHGSRSRHHAFEVHLTGHGRTGGQWGNVDGKKTASWDEWGMFLARLFVRDPQLTIPGVYADLDEFRDQTYDRFISEEQDGYGTPWHLVVNDPYPIHHNHRWNWQYTIVTGIHVYHCRGTSQIDCNAQRRNRRG